MVDTEAGLGTPIPGVLVPVVVGKLQFEVVRCSYISATTTADTFCGAPSSA